MTLVLLSMLAGLCLVLLVSGLLHKSGIYQYPFLAAGVFVGFVLLPLVGLSNDAGLPYGAVDKSIFMSILCLLMVYLGAKLGKKPYRALDWQFSEKRLLVAAAVLSTIGAFFFFQISRLDSELTSASQWTGLPVAYLFFAHLLTYGFAIAALQYAATSSLPALGIMLFGMLFYLDRIFVGARRGTTGELIAIVVLALFFRRGWKVPKSAAVASLALGTLFIWSTGDYRNQVLDQPVLDAIDSIPFWDNLARLLEEGSLELRNTVYQIEAADRLLDFDYGAFHWNILVFNYVPAQLVGSEIKAAMMLPVSDTAYMVFGYEAWKGSTNTGMSDAFQSFWYFGAIEFFLIAYVLTRIYKSGLQGNSTMQLVYMLMIVKGLHAITHSTNWFVSPWVHLGAFLMPALWFARIKKSNGPDGKNLTVTQLGKVKR